MFLNRDTDPTKDQMAKEPAKYSLPELYTSVENFCKEKKKSNLLQTQSTSVGEAQKILIWNLIAMLFPGKAGMRDPQVAVKAKVTQREEKPPSMTELLYRSLLTSSLAPVERLSKSQQRLARSGIPAPRHTFPYDILLHHASSLALFELRKKIQRTMAISRLGHHRSPPVKLIFDDRVPKYLLIDPEKQFLDLRDLEWRYYKGVVSWKQNTSNSSVDIKYMSEKRFVESQQMPDVPSPPLTRSSLIIYP